MTGNDSVKMEWKFYWEHVVRRHKVVIEGWPNSIPLKNLSEVSNSLPELEMLLQRWQTGKTFWKELTPEELEAREEEREALIQAGKIDTPAPRKRRSDYGKKRKRGASAIDGDSSSSKKYKSPETVDSDDEPAAASREESGSNTSPSDSTQAQTGSAPVSATGVGAAVA